MLFLEVGTHHKHHSCDTVFLLTQAEVTNSKVENLTHILNSTTTEPLQTALHNCVCNQMLFRKSKTNKQNTTAFVLYSWVMSWMKVLKYGKARNAVHDSTVPYIKCSCTNKERLMTVCTNPTIYSLSHDQMLLWESILPVTDDAWLGHLSQRQQHVLSGPKRIN